MANTMFAIFLFLAKTIKCERIYEKGINKILISSTEADGTAKYTIKVIINIQIRREKVLRVLIFLVGKTPAKWTSDNIKSKVPVPSTVTNKGDQ